MPILDLSLVTNALATLIVTRVTTGLKKLGQLTTGVKVSLLPTDRLTGDRTIGLYLYHVKESAHTKNLPPTNADVPPVAFTPMGLDLFYQLTAHADPVDDTVSGEAAAARAQLLFGLALKSMHDFASIDKKTVVDGTAIFPSGWQDSDDRIRITLEPIEEKDAAHYWTAGAQPLRLAAYYQVSATLLEPELPSIFPGRVLRFGVQTFARGAPQLSASSNTISFRAPGESVNRVVEARPAEAPVGGEIVFLGTDLAGDSTTLMLRGPGIETAFEVSSDWGVTAATDRIFATVQRKAGPTTIVPGFYTAAAKVTTSLRMPDGSTQTFPQTSNEVPFVVAPAITTPSAMAIAQANAQNVVVLQGYSFHDASFTSDNVKVMAGSKGLVLNDPTQPHAPPPHPLGKGEFEIVDGTTLVPPIVLDDATSPFVIRFEFPAGVASGDVMPLRVLVNGAESPPRWVKAP
jgi:uncharacterized protein DUF4255